MLDAVEVHEEHLDRIVDHDLAMIVLAEEIENKGKELLELTIRGDYESILKVIEELQRIIAKVEDIIAARESILRGT